MNVVCNFLKVRQKAIVGRFAQVVPPTPFTTHRIYKAVPSSIGTQSILSSNPTRSSLPTTIGQPITRETGNFSSNRSYPLMTDEMALLQRDGNLDGQPSIDIDSDGGDFKDSAGNSKRQTVILASEKCGGVTRNNEPETMDASMDEEYNESLESMVFIHVELPLFPLSAFVPKALQEAAAGRNDR